MNSNINFILVQLPEDIEEKSTAFQKGFLKISDLTRFRLNKTIEFFQTRSEGTLSFNESNHDFGYRSFRLKDSNFKIWRSVEINNEEDLVKQTELFATNIELSDKTNDIVWEVLLKNGFTLDSKLYEIEINQISYHLVEGNSLAILSSGINNDILSDILIRKPKKVIALDKIFSNKDCEKTNVLLKLESAHIQFSTI